MAEQTFPTGKGLNGPIKLSQSSAASYSSKDVQRILALAMDEAETFSAETLQEMADELLIDEDALDRAIAQWRSQQWRTQQGVEDQSEWSTEPTQLREAALAAQTQIQARRLRRQRFYRQELVPYVAVNSFLMVLNFSMSGAITWAIYPLLGWGLGLILGVTSGDCRQRAQSQETSVKTGV
ncbi:MAG: 2TM domain-containing protein [Cyanobacteria bacterium J06634_5]